MLSEPTPSESGLFLPRLLPWLILCVGLATTYGLYENAQHAAQRALQDKFNFRSDEIAANIETRLHGYEQVLQGVAGLFAASQMVERDEFREYVNALQLERNFPGIQGVGFSLLVSPKDKPRHIEKIRHEGFPQYAIRPDGERDTYTSIIYLEPFNWRNQRAFGYDMYSEPVRREAMKRARDGNQTAISGKVRLLQETEKDVQAGFLMYVPAYRNGVPHETLEQRRANLAGWAYSPFRMNDLMSGILGKHFGEISDVLDLEIYDGDTVSPGGRLYDSNPKQLRGRFQSIRQLDIGGHHWTVALYSQPAFDAGLKSEKARLIAVSGGAGSLLLALIVWLLVNGRAHALALARHMTQELQERELQMKALFENMSSGVAVYRPSSDGQDFFFTGVNRAAEEIDHIQREEVIGKNVLEVFPGVRDFGLLDVFRRVWQSGVAEQFPVSLYQDGRISGWRENYVYKLPDGSIVAIFDDVSERVRAEKEQERLNQALRLLSECNMALVHADDEHRLLAEVCRLIVETGGYLMAWAGFAEQDENKTVRPVAQYGYEAGYLDSVNISWADTERGRGPTGTAIRNGTTEVNRNFLTNPRMAPWREAAIERGYQSSIALPLFGEQGVLGALTIYSRYPDAFGPEEVKLLEELANDLAFGIVTLRTRAERQAAQEKLAFLAHYDPLTGLPNRLLLRDRFERAASVAEHRNACVAMLFLDLDRFKQVNDSLGHGFGDQLLVGVVERLKGCIRDTDTISRQSGDEFTILLTGISDLRVVGGIAQKIIDAFTEPFEIQGYTISTSFSIGISLFPDDGTEFEVLLKKADTALYHAKDSGRNTYRFFAEKMNVDVLEQMQMQGQLRSAVKNRELRLYYQPQVDIQSGRIIGVEALVRWQRPGGGLVPPASFIPLAEESGLIVPIGEWVLDEACRQAKAWRESGLPPLVVAVNLSGLQFRRGTILDIVSGALERFGLPADCLELELTESILLQDTEATMETLHSLKKIGVMLSIDDFGTGYSSLSYLKRLAVDKLKIDQSFVSNLGENPEDAAIVQAIIQLGHTLQLSVIAEGVETDAQLAFLSAYGCNQAQGYLFSKPVPAEEFAGLLKNGHFKPE